MMLAWFLLCLAELLVFHFEPYPVGAHYSTNFSGGHHHRRVERSLREEVAGPLEVCRLRRVEPDQRIPLGVRSAATRIVQGAERVKYAQAMPTPFALEEMLSSTESALAALAEAPPVAPLVHGTVEVAA